MAARLWRWPGPQPCVALPERHDSRTGNSRLSWRLQTAALCLRSINLVSRQPHAPLEKILRAGLLADSSCSQLCCCLLYRFGSTPGWVPQMGLCRCRNRWFSPPFVRKERACSGVAGGGDGHDELRGARFKAVEVRGARLCEVHRGLCRCSKSGCGREAVSYGSCGELCEVVGDAVGGAERMGYGEARGVRREVRGAHPTDMHNT